jgi:hypothetical protein
MNVITLLNKVPSLCFSARNSLKYSSMTFRVTHSSRMFFPSYRFFKISAQKFSEIFRKLSAEFAGFYFLTQRRIMHYYDYVFILRIQYFLHLQYQ